MADRVTVTMTNGVADVRLSRADKMNALDPAMFDALTATCGRLRMDRSLRAVVLSGEGRAFCAGLDLNSFAAMKEGGIRNIEARTAWNFERLSICGDVLARTRRSGDRGRTWHCLRRRLSARARRRCALCRRRHAHVHHGNKMGHRPRHGRHGPDAAFGARRRDPRTHLHRPDIFGRRGAASTVLPRAYAPTRAPKHWRLARDIADKNPDAIRAAKRLFNIAAAGSDAAACLLAGIARAGAA